MKTIAEKKGLVIVTVLWIVVLLGAMVAVMGRSARLDTRIRLAGTEGLRGKWGCKAGIDTAVALLNEDTTESDSLLDLWSDNSEDLEDVALEGSRFTVVVTDEASKMNINFAGKEQLMALPDITEEIADCIIDWRDSDDDASDIGVEAGYYESLPYSYTARNGPFRTIRELLMVKGVTEELLYGPDTAAAGAGYGINEGWINYLTCYSIDNDRDADGGRRININSADQGDLESSLDLTAGQAKWIIDNRPSNGYTTIAELINDKTAEKPAQSAGTQNSAAASGSSGASGNSGGSGGRSGSSGRGGSSGGKSGSGSGSPSGSGSGGSGNSTEAVQLDLQTFKDIADRITVSERRSGAAKVNVNTASVTVLAVLMGGDQAAYTTAQSIIEYSSGLLFGMESIAEVLDAEGMTVENFKKIAPFITTRSNIYTILSTATADRNGDDGGVTVTEAVIDRNASPPTILYWYEGSRN